MNELLKSLHRNDGVKEEAYKILENTLSLLPPGLLVKNPEALPEYCQTASLAIIKSVSPDIVGNINLTLKGKGLKITPEDLTALMGTTAELFISEMSNAGRVGQMDVVYWAKRAMTLGSNSDTVLSAISASWKDGTLPIFRDFWTRVYKAIDGYINSTLQIAILYAIES
jgi:hypothetical protein